MSSGTRAVSRSGTSLVGVRICPVSRVVVVALTDIVARLEEGDCRSRQRPHERQVRDVHADGGLSQVPELIAGVVDIPKGEILGSDSTSKLGTRQRISEKSAG